VFNIFSLGQVDFSTSVVLLARGAQAKLALIVAQIYPSVRLCVCLSATAWAQHCASRAISTTGLFLILLCYL